MYKYFSMAECCKAILELEFKNSVFMEVVNYLFNFIIVTVFKFQVSAVLIVFNFQVLARNSHLKFFLTVVVIDMDAPTKSK